MSAPLWTPSKGFQQNARMRLFSEYVSQESGLNFANYHQLWRWSVDNREQFWSLLCEYFPIKFSNRGKQVLDESSGMFMAKWFDDSQLNFAENLLRYQDQHIAIEFYNEQGKQQQLTYQQLYQQVSLLAQALQAQGIKPGDRIAAIVPNIPEAVIGMLASTSIGAIWSSCSPDFGQQSLMDRFNQIQPKVILYSDGYVYKGKTHHSQEKITGLIEQLNRVEFAILIPYVQSEPFIDHTNIPIFLWDEFLSNSQADKAINFISLAFNHPIYILYSSGTTGVPKCIVHGAGGTLLQHLKELSLHTNITRDDKLFYYTSTGWMMWNWLVSSLALGARVILYDGCPTYPHMDSLFQLIEKHKITVFGCSAKYISALQNANVKPIEQLKLEQLRCILSTGSPLSSELFDYVYQNIKTDLQLCSISGGTDLISCFALGNPLSPVNRGELQGPGLGMAIEIYSPDGESIIQQKGELVCSKAFPSMPIYFWNDPDNQKYRQAYFSQFPNVWTHGDYAELTKNQGVIIYGRSDTTLNPGGIRIGTAEIYRQLEPFNEIEDSLVIGQEWQGDQRIILFIQLKAHSHLNEQLHHKICQQIRTNTSIHHVPAKIIAIQDIPRTYNGKLAEKAVYQIIHGQTVKNRSALLNPEALDLFQNLEQILTS